MAAISSRDGYRYGELIADSFFSRDETATRLINVTSNRPISGVDGIGVAQAKIPLTYTTIFSPYNTLTLSSFTYAGAEANTTVYYQSVGGKTATYSEGTPTSLTAQAFFGQAVDTTAETAVDASSFRLQSTYGFLSGGIQVANNVASGGNWSGFETVHLMGLTFGINTDGDKFNMYVVVQSTTGVASSDCTGTLVFTYSTYLGRKLGLPDNGTWTVNLSDYASTLTTTTGSATPDDDAPYVSQNAGPAWNTGGNPNWSYYTVEFPYNFEMNMGRYLVVRGNLASDLQSMIYFNDEDSQQSDAIAVLPVNGGYGDLMIYNTPNFEVFKLARPLTVRSLNLYLTRAEDPANTPISFQGVDYFFKFALAVREATKNVELLDSAGGLYTSNAKRMKMTT